MSLRSDYAGVLTPGSSKHSSEDPFVKRSIQRRNVYKGGDKRNRDSLRVSRGSVDQYDIPDGQILAKSAPGSGRTSPTDYLSLSLAAPKAWTPSNMSNPPIEAKVVILGAQGEYHINVTCCSKNNVTNGNIHVTFDCYKSNGFGQLLCY